MYAETLNKLIEELQKMPGIGPKSAQRLAFHILQSTSAQLLQKHGASLSSVDTETQHIQIAVLSIIIYGVSVRTVVLFYGSLLKLRAHIINEVIAEVNSGACIRDSFFGVTEPAEPINFGQV